MNTGGDLNDLKKEALSRKRAVIFDNDGGDVAQLCPGATARDLLETRTKPAMDAGVDTYIYTTGWGTGIGLHDSKVGGVLRNKSGHLSASLVAEFTRNGTDCLRITAEYVKSLGKEFFWGMRMNDTHDAGYDNVFMPENRFKNENPEIMFGNGIRHGAATGVDYLEEKVRDFMVAYIMEVFDNYSVDGVFLDFFRHPVFFRSNANGSVATRNEIDVMNAFMRRVRSELDARSLRDGKYYLVSVRVPDSVEYGRVIGLDIETWLKEGLTDILFTASYMQFNDWTYSAELGHRHNVPVYPSLDESRVPSELPRHKRNSLRGYYGRIMNVWDAGCDGVFMFNNSGLRDLRASIEQNWFARDSGAYQEGLAATVKGKDFVNTLNKTYFASFRGIGRVAGGALPHQDYIRIPTLNHHAPLVIGAGRPMDVPIRLSDDVEAATARGKTPAATVCVFLLGDPGSVRVAMNGRMLDVKASPNTRVDLERGETEYVLKADAPPDLPRRGTNLFTFQADGNATVLDLWVELDYP